MSLLCRHHWKRGDRGWKKKAQRQGEDRVTLGITLILCNPTTTLLQTFGQSNWHKPNIPQNSFQLILLCPLDPRAPRIGNETRGHTKTKQNLNTGIITFGEDDWECLGRNPKGTQTPFVMFFKLVTNLSCLW